MKEKIIKNLAEMILLIAEVSTETASPWFNYQPEEPKEIEQRIQRLKKVENNTLQLPKSR